MHPRSSDRFAPTSLEEACAVPATVLAARVDAT